MNVYPVSPPQLETSESVSLDLCAPIKNRLPETDNEIIAIIASRLVLGTGGEPRKKKMVQAAFCSAMYMYLYRRGIRRVRDLYPLRMAVAITASFFRSKLIN